MVVHGSEVLSQSVGELCAFGISMSVLVALCRYVKVELDPKP